MACPSACKNPFHSSKTAISGAPGESRVTGRRSLVTGRKSRVLSLGPLAKGLTLAEVTEHGRRHPSSVRRNTPYPTPIAHRVSTHALPGRREVRRRYQIADI